MANSLDSPMFNVRISGDLACFTRPEMKVERVSYEVITPSATRGILEAILWKPAIAWVVQRVHVLKPIRWASFKRNEVTGKIPVARLTKAMNSGEAVETIVAEESRAQRHTLALRDVEYVIEAGFRMVPAKAGAEDNPLKFTEMFRRRLENGQWYRAPYLGCREFTARVEPASEGFKAISDSRDLGWMLHDIEFRPGAENLPHFFAARLNDGVIEVPEFKPGLFRQGGAQ